MKSLIFNLFCKDKKEDIREFQKSIIISFELIIRTFGLKSENGNFKRNENYKIFYERIKL
jgi:hypothetical protein